MRGERIDGTWGGSMERVIQLSMLSPRLGSDDHGPFHIGAVQVR